MNGTEWMDGQRQHGKKRASEHWRSGRITKSEESSKVELAGRQAGRQEDAEESIRTFVIERTDRDGNGDMERTWTDKKNYYLRDIETPFGASQSAFPDDRLALVMNQSSLDSETGVE
jgi:hypothetical protein